MIIGTAGHVDHGKSALVQALTGHPVDRLAEERRRGITIELGFTHLDLGDGRTAGVVDVPGHEDFVRTMVAGASGMDVVLLVIAADDGIMPQTREHLLVVEAMAIPSGIAVITRSDLVEPEWLVLVQAEVDAWLGQSPTAFAPAVAVSARTGEGIESLRRMLRDVAPRDSAEHRAGDLFRLPVDRAFTVRGTGTVVTGTTWTGRARVGDTVLVLPAGVEGRVRGIEVHGRPTATAEPGTRTALALAGVEVSVIPRGSVVVHPDRGWAPSHRIDAELRLTPSAVPLRDHGRIRVHLGTAEVMARVRVGDGNTPGATQVARLALESPLVPRGGDRLVVRSYSPVAVIGGGRVLDPHPPGRRMKHGHEWRGEWATVLVARRRAGTTPEDFAILTGAAPSAIDDLVTRGGLVRLGGRIVTQAMIDEWSAQVLAAVAAHHRDLPAEAGCPAELLRTMPGVPAGLAAAILDRLVRSGELAVREGRVALPAFVRRTTADAQQERRVLAAIVSDGLAARTVSELSRDLGHDAGPIVRELARAGSVTAIDRDRFISRGALAAFRATLEAVGTGEPITPGVLRERTGLSRKYLIPLLEWSDAAGITIREGDARRLSPGTRPA